MSSTQVTRVPLPATRGTEAPGRVSPQPQSPLSANRKTEQSAAGPAVPGWLAGLIEALCLIFVGAVVLALVWYLLRDKIRLRTEPVPEAGDPDRLAVQAERVVAAVEAGLVDLSDLDRDPRPAVIACWVRLEEAAAAAGTPREVADTSSDLVLRLLRAHRVSRPVLDGFGSVYRQARYSTGPVDQRMRTTAVAALRQLRSELGAGLAALATVPTQGGGGVAHSGGPAAVQGMPALRRVE
jgi:hypothetical protein